MRQVERQVGLGFEFKVDSYNQQFDELYEALEGRALELADRSGLHATLVYPDEATIPIKSERDIIALENARNECGNYLGHLVGSSITVSTISPRLERFNSRGRSMGVLLDNEGGFLVEVRNKLESILHENAGITLQTSRSYRPHVRIGRRLESATGPRANFKKLPIPEEVNISGFGINQMDSRVEIPGKSRRRVKGSERRVLRPSPARSY